MFIPTIRGLCLRAVLTVAILVAALRLATYKGVLFWLAMMLLLFCILAAKWLLQDVRTYRAGHDYRHLKDEIYRQIQDLLRQNELYTAVSIDQREGLVIRQLRARVFRPAHYMIELQEYRAARSHTTGRVVGQIKSQRFYTFWPNSYAVNKNTAARLYIRGKSRAPARELGPERTSFLAYAARLRKMPIELLYADAAELQEIQTVLNSFIPSKPIEE